MTHPWYDAAKKALQSWDGQGDIVIFSAPGIDGVTSSRVCARCRTEPSWGLKLCDGCTKQAWWEDFAPRRFVDASWDGLERLWPAELVAELVAWLNRNDCANLGLIGPPGTGKTGAALVAARDLCGAGLDAKFTTLAEMLTDLARRQLDDDDPVADYVDPDVLILDDLAAGTKSELTSWQVGRLHSVVDGRWREERTTIWTSNLSVAALKQYLDERTWDRLRDGAVILKVSGQSHRRLAS